MADGRINTNKLLLYFFSCFLVNFPLSSWRLTLLFVRFSFCWFSRETCCTAWRIAVCTICLLAFCSLTSSCSGPGFSLKHETKGRLRQRSLPLSLHQGAPLLTTHDSTNNSPQKTLPTLLLCPHPHPRRSAAWRCFSHRRSFGERQQWGSDPFFACFCTLCFQPLHLLPVLLHGVGDPSINHGLGQNTVL